MNRKSRKKRNKRKKYWERVDLVLDRMRPRPVIMAEGPTQADFDDAEIYGLANPLRGIYRHHLQSLESCTKD